ncbi:major capsid protein [Blackfly microvirus SF02]|uniref:Major capsid protein n=1 Tax=Blackfly microvirus SF02 TaxID=2576452 RepID=A0A4P8PJN5_9VIRU|nr:major capsid protein [Blackfly microvirus SF02]
MKSVMRHQFSQVPKATIQRSSFDRSHGHKTTFDAGWLVPIYVDEALPGDTFNLRMTSFARLSTPLHPIMDNMFCDVFFFAVPYRLVWSHFVNFFGEQDNPTDTTSYLVPTATVPSVGGYAFHSMQDYMGLPTGTNVAGVTHSNLHCRAYNLIWNQWFRDENLQNSVVVDKGDGPDNPANYNLMRRGKRHDYYTSALPWPQKGPAVQLPIVGGTGLLAVAPQSTQMVTGAQPALSIRTAAAGATPAPGTLGIDGAGNLSANATATGGGGVYPSNLAVNFSASTIATINQLRQAFQIQKIYERDARGGTRYTELVLSHFGVSSPDARLQRAEYLGGGSTPVNINPIAQTSGTGISGSTTPQGSLTGVGTFSHRGVGFTKSFTEHCLLLGLVSVRADITYQQGIKRHWSRSTRFDFYWPGLSHIGEQAILSQELTLVGTLNAVFGYQERYAEYRYFPSLVTGQFRSSFPQTLDSWHLAQSFAGTPTLGDTFIQDNPPIARVVAVPTQPHFLFDSYFHLQCARPMPVYGVPGLIDHF